MRCVLAYVLVAACCSWLQMAGDVLSWGECLTRISAETADVIVVVAVVVVYIQNITIF